MVQGWPIRASVERLYDGRGGAVNGWRASKNLGRPRERVPRSALQIRGLLLQDEIDPRHSHGLAVRVSRPASTSLSAPSKSSETRSSALIACASARSSTASPRLTRQPPLK